MPGGRPGPQRGGWTREGRRRDARVSVGGVDGWGAGLRVRGTGRWQRPRREVVGWEGGGVKGRMGRRLGTRGWGAGAREGMGAATRGRVEAEGGDGRAEEPKRGGPGPAGERRQREAAGSPGGSPRGAGGGRAGSARALRPRPDSALWTERSLGGGGARGRAAKRGVGRDRGLAENLHWRPRTGREGSSPAANWAGGGPGAEEQDPTASGQDPWGWRVKSGGQGGCSARDEGFRSHLSAAFDSLAAGKTGIREELPLAPGFPGQIPSPLPHLSRPERTG